MNNKEVIVFLGEKEGAKLRIGKTVDDINPDLPYFKIDDDRVLKGYNYARHDNADRMPLLLQYLQQFVLPHVDKDADLKGYYNVELHDSNSYLQNDIDYSNCLVWSRNKNDRRSVLLPDIYQMTNYGNKLNAVDKIAWHAKQNQVAFYGTTTGLRDPAENMRIKWCHWKTVNDTDDCCHWYITNVAQMRTDDIVRVYGESVWSKMSRPYVSHTALYNYKFNLDIPGNTASWDRVPVVLNSASLLFKAPCSDMCFYYPLLHHGEHYIEVASPEEAVKKQKYYLSNNADVLRITSNANNFVKDYLTPNAAIRYMVALFESCSFHSR